MNAVLRTAPSGPEVQYPLTLVGQVLTVDTDGKVRPKPDTLTVPFVEFGPPSGGDDAALLSALMASEGAGQKRAIQLMPAATPYRFKSQINLNANSPDVYGAEGVEIRVELVDAGATPIPAAFYVDYAATNVTTMAAAAKCNQRVVTVANQLTRGDVVLIGPTLKVVQDVAANGPNWDITLDRELEEPVANGATVSKFTSYGNRWICDGNGAKISGTASRFWSLNSSIGCIVRNWILTDKYGCPNQWGSWDVGGSGNRFEKLIPQIDPAAVATTGPTIGIEVNYNSQVVDCELPRLALISFDACYECKVIDSTAYALLLTALQGPQSFNNEATRSQIAVVTIGSVGDTGTHKKFGIHGGQINQLAFIKDCPQTVLDTNLTIRLTPGAAAIAANDNVTDLTLRDVTAPSLYTGATAVTTSTVAWLLGAVGKGMNVTLENVTVDDAMLAFWQGACPVNINGKNVRNVITNLTGVVANYYNANSSTSTLKFVDSTFNSGSAFMSFYQTGPAAVVRMTLENTSITSIRAIYSDGGITCLFTDAKSTLTGSLTNVQRASGTIALNGATPVTYNFAALLSTDLVTVTREAQAGTPGNGSWSLTDGVGAVLTGTALDTSTMRVNVTPFGARAGYFAAAG